MTVDQTIALASAVCAAISIIANAVQAYWIYRLTASATDKSSQADKFAALHSELSRTRLFTMEPYDEVWEYGFETLRNVGVLLGAVETAVIRRSGNVPKALRHTLTEVSAMIRDVRAYNDGYTALRRHRNLAPHEVQREWADWHRSVAALQRLQPRVSDLKLQIEAWLADR